MKKHRNSQKRIYFKDACYFITVKTFNNFPYFRKKLFCNLFVENLRLCKQMKEFFLYGWVLIYNHFHLQIQPGDKFDISDVMFSIKKQFAHDVNRVIGFNELYPHLKAGKRLPAFGDGNINENRQLIINHQNYVNKLQKQFIQKHKSQNSYPKFKWQDKFHDHYIRNENDFNYHMEYIEYNPIKHGLPNDWPYIYTNPKYENLTDEYL